MSQEVHIVAILALKPGKLDRMKELMRDMCKTVHSKEEEMTHRYLATEQIGEENPKIIMIETYKDKQSADAHTQTDHFKKLIKDFTDEDVLAEAPLLMQTKSTLGFERDRKLL